ncbi:PWWP domain-containing protein MUM1 [Lonchura striata]|uniref:PWWP domain-containing protein MUM1 n=1 Tax=Lonchura striata TaxID=40157 RepID=A0A218VB64_9PASE|nr:PWWP domain-containing protein MUM1 [Lonchura striata domestica]
MTDQEFILCKWKRRLWPAKVLCKPGAARSSPIAATKKMGFKAEILGLEKQVSVSSANVVPLTEKQINAIASTLEQNTSMSEAVEELQYCRSLKIALDILHQTDSCSEMSPAEEPNPEFSREKSAPPTPSHGFLLRSRSRKSEPEVVKRKRKPQNNCGLKDESQARSQGGSVAPEGKSDWKWHKPCRGKSSPKWGMESPVSQRLEELSKKGKEDVGMIPPRIKQQWLLRRGFPLSPLNLAPWNLPERQELSLGERSWIPAVKLPRMNWRKAFTARVRAWQSSWMGGERQRLENTWMGQVWPQAQTGNAGTTLDPHLGLLVPSLSLRRRKTTIPHTWLGIKPLTPRKMKGWNPLGCLPGEFLRRASLHSRPLSNEEEENLPSVLSYREPEFFEEDVLVWCKRRRYPHWPAVVKAVKRKHQRACVLFIDGTINEKKKGFSVSLKSLKHFDCGEKQELIERAKENYSRETDWCLQLILDYRVRVGCHSFAGSFLEYFAADISYPMRKEGCQSVVQMAFLNTGEEGAGQSSSDTSPQKPPRRLLPDRTRAAMERENKKLVEFIVKTKGAEEHLLGILKSGKQSRWLKKFLNSSRYVTCVKSYLEDEEQLDLVDLLKEVYKKMDTKNLHQILGDGIRFILDVLLPEAIICAIAAMDNIDYEKAEEKYIKGPPVSKRASVPAQSSQI